METPWSTSLEGLAPTTQRWQGCLQNSATFTLPPGREVESQTHRLPTPGQNTVAKNLYRPGASLGFSNGGEES